jgi:ABC-2 type transport system permease protein
VSRILLVFWREYLENVRTKAFLIGLVLTPLWFVLVFAIPMLGGGPERQSVVIVDATGVLADDLAKDLAGRGSRDDPRYEVTVESAEGAWTPGPDGTSRVESLRRRGAEGEIFAVILTPPLLEKRPPGPGEQPTEVLGANSLGAMETGRDLERTVNDLVNRRIVDSQQVPRELAERLLRPAVSYTGLSREGEAASPAFVMAPLAFMLLLFMGIVGISQMLISSTLEEKANRVYEVLLSSVSPFQLMTGKLLGICAVGFTLMVLWAGGGLTAASIQGIDDLVTGAQVGLLVLYYILGFFLVASLMVAVGSACNTLKEAQNLMAPISLMLAFPILLALIVLRDPNGTFATVASFFPPFTPFLMMARLGSVPSPPAWQVPASLLLLAISTVLALRLSARIFRVGILLYGKPPRLKEIWRWMRTPD